MELSSITNDEKIFISSQSYDQVEPKCSWPHFSVTRRIWEYLIFFASMITPIEISYVLIFDRHISEKSYSVFFLVDIIQLIDNFVVLKTPFLKNGILITNMKEILKNYGIFFYIMHVIASLPMGWIGLIKNDVTLYVILSINKLLRLHQAWRSYKIIQYSTYYNRPIFHLFPFFLLFIFMIHIFACAFYLIAYLNNFNDSWLSKHINNCSNFQLYIYSLYFVCTTIFTIGYGDFHPSTINECLITIVIQAIGVIFESVLIAKMVSSFSNPQKTKFIADYKIMQEYLKSKGVDETYIKYVRHYYQGLWEKNHGILSWDALFKEIPDSIKSSIILETCRNVIRQVDIFKGLSENDLLLLMDKLEPFTFIPDDIIYKPGDLFSDLLIIKSGAVRLMMVDFVVGTHTIENGYVDCEKGLFFNEPKDRTLLAVTFIEGWKMKRSSFSKLIHSNPTIQKIVFKNAREKFPDSFRDSSKQAAFVIEDEFNDSDNENQSDSSDSSDHYSSKLKLQEF